MSETVIHPLTGEQIPRIGEDTFIHPLTGEVLKKGTKREPAEAPQETIDTLRDDPSIMDKIREGFGNVMEFIGAKEEPLRQLEYRQERIQKFLGVPDEMVEQWKEKGEIGATEAVMETDTTELLPVAGGIERAWKAVSLLRATNRLKEDYYIDETQKERDMGLVASYMMKTFEEQVRGYTTGASITKGVLELPSYMIEFALTGFGATAGKKAVRKALTKSLSKLAVNRAGIVASKIATKGAGWLTSGILRTVQTPYKVAEQYAQNRMPYLSLSPEGEIIVGEAENTPFISTWKAFGDVTIEWMSEEAGAALGRGAKKLVPKRMGKLLKSAFRRLHPGQKISKLFTKAGYHGFLEELGEEQLGRMMRMATGVEDFGVGEGVTMFEKIMATIPGAEQFLIEVGVLAVPGIANASLTSVAGKRARTKAINKIIESSKQDVIEGQREVQDIVAPEETRKQEEIKEDEEAVEILVEKPPTPEAKGKSLEEFLESHMKVYHQTSENIAKKIKEEGFKVVRGEMAKGDPMPLGINTKATDKQIRLKDKNIQLAAYLPKNAKIKTFADREQVKRYLKSHKQGKKYADLVDRMNILDRDYGKVVDDLIDYKEGQTREQVGKNLDKAEDIIQEWKKKGDELGDKASKEASKILLDEGYDAIKIDKDTGGTFGKLSTDNLIILKESLAKTKAQLTNIWKQAQEEKVIKKPKPKTQEEIRGLPKRAEKIIKDLRKEEATARQRKIAQDTLRVLTDKIKEYRHQVIPYEKGYLQEEYNELDFYFRGKEGMTLDVVAIELEIEGDMEARDYLNNLLEQRDSLRQEIKDTKAAYETRKKVTILKQRLSDIQQGIKTGQKLTAKEIKRTQEKVIKVLEIADLTAKDKAKFIRTIKNIQTRQQFEKNIPKIQERIIELVEKQQRRILKSQINKELKKTKVKKQAGKPVGKFTPEIQKALDVMRNANKVKVSEAQELLNRSLSKQPDEISVYDKIANQIFVVKAGVADVATMRNTLKGIIELKEKGRKANLLKGEQLKEEKEQAIKETIDIITGGKGKTWSKTSTIKEFQESKIRGRIAQFAKSQVGWQDLLDILSYNAPGTRGESFLNEFGDIFGEKIAEKKGTRVAFEEIRELGRKAFGFEKDSQFAERLMKDLQDTFTYTGTNVKGEKIFIEMNRTQVRKRYMEIQDPSLIEMITHEEGMAYTSDIIQAMERFLTKEDKAFVEAQMKFYKNYYKKVNKVYRDIYGVDLPFNEFYSPIAREGVETDIEGVTALMQEIKQRISTTTGSLKSRVPNFHKLKDQSDTTVLQKHIIDMEHFMAWSKKLKKIKSVFGNPDVKTAITLYFGNGMNRQLSSFLQDFTRGGIEAGKRVAGLDRIRGNFARSVLAIKPSIAIKQLTSFLAYMEAMPTIDFVSGQMDFWKHPIENSKILLGSEYMKARGQSVTRDLKTAMQSDEFQNFRGNPNFWNSLMLNIQLGDKGAILMGGWSLYKYNLKQGKTHEQALRAFEEFSDRTQQSGDLDQLSVIQRGGSWAKLFTMFKSAPQQYFRKELAAVKDIALKKGAYKSTKAWKTILIYHIILPGLFQFVANGFRWDDDDQRRAAILGPLNGIPLVGDGIEYLIRIVLGQMTWDLANPLLAPFKEIGGAFDALADMREEGISIEDMKRAISGILSVTGVTIGAPLESTFNMGFGLWKLGTGQTTTAKGLKELAGWSEWVIERKDEKKKRKIEF